MSFGSYMAMTTFENDFARWPVGQTDVRKAYDRFQQEFESTDILIVSWPSCRKDNNEVSELASSLGSAPLNAYVESVSDGKSVYESLTGTLGISAKRALRRLQGSFLGPDEQQTCLYVALNRHGTKNRQQLLDGVKAALGKLGVGENDVRFAGPAFNMHSIDMEGFWSPLRAVPLIAFLSFLITWFFVRRLILAVFISAMSGYTGGLALTVVYLSGQSLNSLVWTMPSLVLLLTTSAALHFLGYYRQAIADVDIAEAHRVALTRAWKPILYCALTTAVGLFSLMLSDMRPVKQFGVFGGISVLASAGIVLGCLPHWLQIFPFEESQIDRGRFWERWAQFTVAFRWPIMVSVLLSGTILLLQIPKLQTSAHISNFFPASSKVVVDSKWIDEKIGSHSTIEMVVTFGSPKEANDVSRMKMIEYLQRKFLKLETISGSVSGATYAPVWPKKKGGVGAVLEKEAVASKVQRIKQELVESELVAIDKAANSESWRLSLRVDESKSKIGPEYVRQLEKVATDIFADTADTHFPGESVELTSTGQAVLFDYVETQFLKDLGLTFATAFVLISIVIFLIMRNLSCVCIATPPNLIPAALVLGLVATLGFYLDVGSLMTASVALGIAVDDTLHFVLWWRERVRSGMKNHDAIVDAMKHCGLAMVQTTVVCGLSIALYSYCGFLPTVRFGLLLSGMLFAALVGDLLLLPALLSTRLGKKAAGL